MRLAILIMVVFGLSACSAGAALTTAPSPAAPATLARPTCGARTPDGALARQLTSVTALAVRRLAAAANATSARMPKAAYPGDRAWRRGSAADWTAGFFPGSLWLAYQLTGDVVWATRARRWTAPMLLQTNSPSHDIGFMLMPSVGGEWQFDGSATARAALIAGGRSLSRHYVPGARAGTTWPSGRADGVRVIVDSVMDVEILLRAGALSGEDSLTERGHQHALTVLRTLVRPDGSTFHVVDLRASDGAVLDHFSAQGLATDSTWARGQAWALNGLTTAYRGTGDVALLRGARRVADWWIAHVNASCVPLWDFAAPRRPGTPRDTSAAAIAASGLLALAALETDPARAARDRAVAVATVTALTDPRQPWLAPAGSPSILQHEVYSHGSDVGAFVWGDYYLLEAIARLRFGAPLMGQ